MIQETLNQLNDAQKAAVLHTNGPLLVLAGAGTGKTRVVTTKIAHMLLNQNIKPYNILAITFTNKAAAQMRDRIQQFTNQANLNTNGMWIDTFHGAGVKILRTYADKIGLSNHFTIIDTQDQLSLIKQILKEEEIEKTDSDSILKLINTLKEQLISPQQLDDDYLANHIKDKDKRAVFFKVYDIYELRIRTFNVVDFPDLLALPIKIFQTNPQVLEEYQNRFQHIFVDEYQDINVTQYIFLKLLSQRHQNICCVGDDDQSIYSWRGSKVDHILNFHQDFESAHVIRLEQNYRSTKNILQAANILISHNKSRLGKSLWTDGNSGQKIKIIGTNDGPHEAQTITEEIHNLLQQGISHNKVAILLRMHSLTREFEDTLTKKGIAYKIVGSRRFFERKEIKDCIAYLKIAAQPHDNLAFSRIINLPPRGIGDKTIQTITQYGDKHGLSLSKACLDIVNHTQLRANTKHSLEILLGQLNKWHKEIYEMPLDQVGRRILNESGYIDMWRGHTDPNASERLSNIDSLITSLKNWHNIDEFLEYVALTNEIATKASEQDQAISIMTLHTAKGLEFDHVFLCAWEESIFPSVDKYNNPTAMEEERRLAYVGLTRARQNVTISHASSRMMYGKSRYNQQSRFINELSTHDLVEHIATNSTFTQTPSKRSYFYSNSSNLALKQDPHVGKRAYHPIFGSGIIEAVSGQAATVNFPQCGRKKIMMEFLSVS